MNLNTVPHFVLQLNCIHIRFDFSFLNKFLFPSEFQIVGLSKLRIISFLVFLGCHSIFAQVHQSLDFEWNSTDEAFYLQGVNSPTLTLYEHCFYRFDSSVGEFSITELNNSLYSGAELFQNRIKGAGEYIFFSPDENTPRSLLYQNLNHPSNQGTILIKSFDDRGFIKMDVAQDSARFGSNVVVTNDLTIFASAPGFDDNEGLINKYFLNEDGNYSFDFTISPPSTTSPFFGSSMLYDPGSSKLFFGVPNADNYVGALYDYSLLGESLTKVSEGYSFGDMHGWSSSSTSDKIFIGSLSVLDSEGGHVSVLNSTVSPPSFLYDLRASTIQFGNEFGYALSSRQDYLLAGAPGEDDLIREGTGAAYLFKLGGNSVLSSKILPNNRNDGDRFGHSVHLTDELIFVSAPNGDGMAPNSGLVHVFSYDSENLDVTEVFQILPPVAASGIKFGQNICIHGNFVFVSAPKNGETGTVYVFKKSYDSLSWLHVNSISLDQFSSDLSLPENISLAVNKGILVIGLEGESSVHADSGAIKVLYNPAWDELSVPPLHPFFENNEVIEVNATEDQADPVTVDFNASVAGVFANQIGWEIKSVNESIAAEYFDINATTGEFQFNLPQDLSGVISFELSVMYESQKHSHLFDVRIDPIQDNPRFIDFSSVDGSVHVLPKATVNDDFLFAFNTFDPDGDNLSLSLHSGQLPDGLAIDGLSLAGIPGSEGNFTFSLSLSDGVNPVNQSFTIEVFPSNFGPKMFFLGEELTSPYALNLQFPENFSLSDWQGALSSLNISDVDSEVIFIEVLNPPSNGYLVVTDQFETFAQNLIRYTPSFNFNGNDSFSLRFSDKHPASPKYFDLTFDLIIESQNTSPFVTSADPPGSVAEGQYFEHIFEVFDAEEDYYTVSFQNLPDWLVFDGVRRIFGKPSQSDFEESPNPFFISVSDQWGSTFTKKLQIGVIPQNYPPVIGYLDENVSQISLSLVEDADPVEFELSASDADDENTTLLWQISSPALHGKALILSQGSTGSTISYHPDGNFSGYDYFDVMVAEENDSFASDKITVECYVASTPDPPKFETQPFPGLAYNKPWIYEIRGIDGDHNDNLTLQSLLNLPDWLKLSQTDNRTWTFRGHPTNVGEEIPISLRLSDQNTSVDQNFTLKVLENVEDLNFTHTDEIDLMVDADFPQTKHADIFLDEDTNWSIGRLAVNAINDVRVMWQIAQETEHGSFSFALGGNGEIVDLVYLPDQHFFGSDKIVLEASDNYSKARVEINFHVQSVEDPLIFYDFPSGLIENENEKYELFISHEDGDGLHTLNEIEFLGLPSWLEVETYASTAFSQTHRLFGEPTVDDTGTSSISAKISDKAGNQVQVDFQLKVNFFNKPPVPSPNAISASFMEDSFTENFPKRWLNFFSVTDEETSADELTWSIVSSPLHGYARIDERGLEVSYYPDANFSGDDFFSIGVMDRGGANNSLPRQAIIPVSITVLQENDLPIFQTSPPSDSNNSFSTTWNDERDYSYELSVLDSDWPWQGYPSLSLRSSLPSWASWKTLGNGKALISGSPMWFHQGNYSFSIVAQSGGDEVVQNFDLAILVNDYPPRVQNQSNQLIYKKIQLFVIEDGSVDDVKNTVHGLRAFNPDKVAGETLRWLPYTPPSSGGSLSLSSYLDEDKIFARVSGFEYQLPEHFNGIDQFSLIVDEGDRQTEVPFEVTVKSIPDPPEFLEDGPVSLSVARGSYIERVILAKDPDGQTVDFKLLYPANHSKWLTIKSEDNHASEPSVKIGGIVPQSTEDESFTLIASDPTGRFSLLEINISANP